MADDPRNDTREKIIDDWCPDYSEAGRRTMLAELDRADPLRALLADEDRAVVAEPSALRTPYEWASRVAAVRAALTGTDTAGG